MKIPFHKLSGSGNDFIVIDNRDSIIDETALTVFVSGVCNRKMSVGADGIILIEKSDAADFKWRFYNSDGSPAEMCGNGARCVARFAYENGIADSRMSFETKAGMITAQVTHNRVKVKMPDPHSLNVNYVLELDYQPLLISSINTGVPHVVIKTDSINDVQVCGLGKKIRFHNLFSPAGTNVNFVSIDNDGKIFNRTYERGVEDETLACGTGCIASALILAYQDNLTSPIQVFTRGGECLTVYFDKTEGTFYDIYLEGGTRMICSGELLEDAWK